MFFPGGFVLFCFLALFFVLFFVVGVFFYIAKECVIGGIG